MSLFHLVAGLTEGTADYVKQQRQRQRDLEDQDFAFRVRMLENEANRPDFDSTNYERLLGELLNMSGERKSRGASVKSGKAGFLGQQPDLGHGPISQFISGAATGDHTKPFVSPGQHLADMPAKGVGQPAVGAPMDLHGVMTGGAAGAPAAGDGTAPAPGGASPAAAPAGAPAAPAAMTPPPGVAPAVPAAQLPSSGAPAQVSNSGGITGAMNAAADEAQHPVAAPKALPAPPGAAGGSFQAPFEVGPAGGPGGLRFTSEQMAKKDANKAAMAGYGQQFGQITGKVGAYTAATGGKVPDEVLQHLAFGMPFATYKTQNAIVNGQNMLVRVNNRTGAVSDEQGQPVSGEIRLEGLASPYVVRSVVGPDGEVTTQWVPRYSPEQGVTTKKTAPAGTGRVQFAPPPINVGESQDTQGNTTRTYVPRERVGRGGSALPTPPGGGAPKAGTSAPDSGTGVSVERTKGGGMTVRRAPIAKFGEQQRAALSGIDSASRFAQDAIKFIEQSGLQNDNNPLETRWNNFLYSHGIDPGEAEKLIQTVGITEPKAIIGQMGGQRGQYWGELLARHTPQASNTYALMYKKLQNLVKIGEGIKQDINQSAMVVPTASGPRVPSLKTPPGGKPVKMKAPDGTVKSVQPDQVEHFKSLGAVIVQ